MICFAIRAAECVGVAREKQAAPITRRSLLKLRSGTMPLHQASTDK